MNRQNINRVCATIPIVLSLMACVWVLGNLSGGAQSREDEGLGFHIFWLLILAQMPFVLGYPVTADWHRWPKVTTRIALQVAALILAFCPIAYFHL